MQFHTNGFHPGDPLQQCPRPAVASGSQAPLPAEVDVLIVGCGPAGLMLAAQLAQFGDIATCIVDQKSGPIDVGQADGISGRSLEIFEALNFSERVLKEAYFLKAISFWKYDSDNPSCIVRTEKKTDGRSVFSEFPHVVLNQARIHDFLLDTMQRAPAGIRPFYRRTLHSLTSVAANTIGHPVTAQFEHTLDDGSTRQETIRARFCVGCDGARSAVRSAIGLEAKGDFANKAWGVMDCLLTTDFPDIRIKSVVQSAEEGSVLIIPREGGHLVRFYVELDQLKASERVSARHLTQMQLIEAAQRIMRPYTLTIKEVPWWSVYEIGQRVCDHFDNRDTTDLSSEPTVFIAGDACHTHSPKAGQGMNVSMHDSFNLGWKLAAVLRKHSPGVLLRSYSDERQAIAQELIDFDRELAAIFSRPPEPHHSAEPTASATTLQDYLIRADGYVSGTLVRYRPSPWIGDDRHQGLAPGLRIGCRFHSAAVTRLVDARPMHLGHALKADGRWRLIAFANNNRSAHADSALYRLGEFFADPERSPTQRYTPEHGDADSVIEVLVVVQEHYLECTVTELHPAFWPAKGRYGLYDYEKVFTAAVDTPDIYDLRGIQREQGCVVIVRPDQHIAAILPLDDLDGISAFFSKVLIPNDGR